MRHATQLRLFSSPSTPISRSDHAAPSRTPPEGLHFERTSTLCGQNMERFKVTSLGGGKKYGAANVEEDFGKVENGDDTKSDHALDDASVMVEPASGPSTPPPAGNDTRPIVDGKEDNAEMYSAHNLYLYDEEMQGRPKVAAFLSSLGDYSATIEAAPADPDSKSHQAKGGAQMGTLIGVYLPCMQNIFGTLLTSISMSAVATNGVVPAGGSYYMISRALGPEFGGAVGLLFYLGTTVAGAMYIIGAVEILLLYMAPGMSVGGDVQVDLEARFNNFRLYGSCLLFLLCCIIFVGVKMVNKFASVALACVLLSILAVYTGIFVNVNGNDSLMMCLLGNRLLNQDKIGGNCSKEFGTPLFKSLCSLKDNVSSPTNESSYECDPYFHENEVESVPGIPGLSSGVFLRNIQSSYLYTGAYMSRYDEKDDAIGVGVIDEFSPFVQADITTSFIVLIGIFFPSVTGLHRRIDNHRDSPLVLHH
ncbi:unnamed protein product [Darwinula stevensoni]|uniref:Amino acid permease/ SLC12A domain-containing protein n=1 Tax=Darwinula stevensoni TaxID=69355 RepID=A0A7R8ZY09_9CRUS|nr:unnamed protein product [Darwinula stevensoni]CAG0880541.1 unnamed protein product [Darwinula stevensoni]